MIKLIKKLIPNFLKAYYRKYRMTKKYSTEYLRKNYVTDLTEDERWSILSLLLSLEKTQDAVHYLEVGIYAGGTLRYLFDRTKQTYFTGVDLFEDFKLSDDNTHMWHNYTLDQVNKVFNSARVRLIKGYSSDILQHLKPENKFDIIFIDGNHTYAATKEDFLLSVPLLRNSGYICFHNASPGYSPEDRNYLEKDGGPFRLCLEVRQIKEFKFLYSVARIQIFQYMCS